MPDRSSSPSRDTHGRTNLFMIVYPSLSHLRVIFAFSGGNQQQRTQGQLNIAVHSIPFSPASPEGKPISDSQHSGHSHSPCSHLNTKTTKNYLYYSHTIDLVLQPSMRRESKQRQRNTAATAAAAVAHDRPCFNNPMSRQSDQKKPRSTLPQTRHNKYTRWGKKHRIANC